MKRMLIVSVLILLTGAAFSQKGYPRWFDVDTDVGNPVLAGNSIFNVSDQTFLLQGAGANMWFKKDQFHFLGRRIEGDFIISATIQFVGKGVEAHRKIGIMARETLDSNSAYADGCVHGDVLTSLQYRENIDSNTAEVKISSHHPTQIQLRREGDRFYFSAATNGEPYKTVSKELKLAGTLYAGLFICSHNPEVLEKAIFSNVRVVIPAKNDFRPYQDYLGSHLEIMNVETGLRNILWNDPRSIQAPNWSHDGQYLLFNSEGRLYKFRLNEGSIDTLNTGEAINNNNDHVYSFDGKFLGISNHTGADRISTIFILPSSGSNQPEQLTSPEKGHSYLHGFSPDGKKIVFTGQRNNQFDIWSLDMATKKEMALTNEPTLDDGAEYSPDGKWIYFNSARTGTMQLWRMKADGSDPEQLTFDQFNNWFPHLSPDGRWLVYLAFPESVDAEDHPFYKQVYINLMPADGGVAKTIAWLYGGQGTINVPSWSPDSKHIAFVSNTGWPIPAVTK